MADSIRRCAAIEQRTTVTTRSARTAFAKGNTMTTIRLDGTATPTVNTPQSTAFATLSSQLFFDLTLKPLFLLPYLIKFVSKTGNTLVFQGVDLSDSTKLFGALMAPRPPPFPSISATSMNLTCTPRAPSPASAAPSPMASSS